MPFKNKVALITGGGKGLGFHMAKELLNRNLKGVMLVGRTGNDLACAADELGRTKAKVEVCNVQNFSELEDAFIATVEKFDNLDIVVNNAGINDEEVWEDMVETNLNAVVQSTFLSLKKYLSNNFCGSEGYVVNVASVLGLQPISAMPVYAATKHGVIGFTRSIGTQYYYDNSFCKVVALCPGISYTDFVKKDDKLFTEALKTMEQQSPECVGIALCDMLTKNPDNGSVWIAEGKAAVYELDFPDWRINRKNRGKRKGKECHK